MDPTNRKLGINMSIHNDSKAGDIFNVRGADYSKYPLLKRIAYWIVIQIIVIYQLVVYGKKSNHLDHHTMIYFDEDHVFSVQPPKPLYLKLSECLKDKEIISVYRYTKKELNDWDIRQMRDACDKIIGANQPYDIGQLMDILIDGIAGYPYKKKFSLFDSGKWSMVCSVGGASVYNFLRHQLWFIQHYDMKQLFSKLNPEAWSPAFVKKFNKKHYWDIDRTSPANFANTNTHFDNEFELIGEYLLGNKI
jgi:hypothetical protein